MKYVINQIPIFVSHSKFIAAMKTNDNLENKFADMATMIGERGRAMMLWNLLDGKAYTAGELAASANISPQSASNHLSKLIGAKLLAVEKQGRHKYYRFADEKVAQAIENMAALLPFEYNLAQTKEQKPDGIKLARTCYDHLAGKIGVEITNAMLKKGIIKKANKEYSVSDFGKKWFNEIGVDIEEARQMKRKFAFPCLDWSERKHHLAGALGAAFLTSIIEKDWIRKKKDSREVIITGRGERELNKCLGL